jgi:hypothetical protein
MKNIQSPSIVPETNTRIEITIPDLKAAFEDAAQAMRRFAAVIEPHRLEILLSVS